MIRLAPQLNRHRLADFETAEALLRQADQYFTLAIGGQGEQGLAGGDDLAHFNGTPGDDTVLGRTQHGIPGLVAGHVELSLDLLEACNTGSIKIFGIVVLDRLTI